MFDGSASTKSDDDRTLFGRRSYLLYLSGRFCGTLANTAQAVVIAWEVYEIARQSMSVAEAAFVVGMIGLVQFLPVFCLTLIAGETADRHDRRVILALCFLMQVLISILLATHAKFGGGLWPIFALSGVFGGVRAFFQPTASALGPILVPVHLLPRAIATNSLAFQLARILGPALGGVLCAASPTIGFAVCAGLYAVSTVCALFIRGDTQPLFEQGRSRSEQIREGLSYLWQDKMVLGAISLDLFAVLFGGATGLLPIFARDELQVGPEGYGMLRSAPAAGALLVARYLLVRPIRTRVGMKMFLAVGLFGLMTIVFAFSRSFPLSLLALAVLGGADRVSVFARQSLVQIATPDRMGGCVSAVSTLFIGALNELGEFESGVVARLLGPVGSVAFGGAGALFVTGLWAWLFPSLRKADRLV